MANITSFVPTNSIQRIIFQEADIAFIASCANQDSKDNPFTPWMSPRSTVASSDNLYSRAKFHSVLLYPDDFVGAPDKVVAGLPLPLAAIVRYVGVTFECEPLAWVP